MPLDSWSIEDYERQWREGLERIKTSDKSCLIIEAHNLNKSPFINWWLLYNEGSKIVIRNQVLFQKYYKKAVGDKPFTVDSCYDFVPDKRPRQLPTGELASEWVVQLHA